MADFISEDLTGSRFEDVYLTGARFRDADLTNARFHLVDLTGVMIRGAVLVNVDISGEIKNMRVNGVDVVPLVAAELNRRYPDRAKMRPADADGFREAWDILERLWQQTAGRVRGMAPELLHERVEGEWSFIETLRHLVFATDAWVKHRAGLPRTGELRRTPLPAGHPQRGVGAQAVRRKGPPHARVPVALTPGAASALDEARDAVLFIRDPNRETFSRMVADPGYQQVTHLRSCTGSALGVRSPHKCWDTAPALRETPARQSCAGSRPQDRTDS